MPGIYVAGSIVTVATWQTSGSVLQGGFRDRTGNPGDPNVVTLKWRTPDGVAHSVSYPTLPIVKDTVLGVTLGLYHADLDTTALPGQWNGEWMSPSGDPLQAIAVWSFVVVPAPV